MEPRMAPRSPPETSWGLWAAPGALLGYKSAITQTTIKTTVFVRFCEVFEPPEAVLGPL